MGLPFSEMTEKVLVLASKESRKLEHYYIGTEHVLIAICLSEDEDVEEIFEKCGLGTEEVIERTLDRISQLKADTELDSPVYTPRQKKVFSLADRIGRHYHFSRIEPLHLLLAIVHEGEGLAVRVLRECGCPLDELDLELKLFMRQKAIDTRSEILSKNTPFLNKIGRDLTALAREGELTPVIGRKDAIRKVAQILARKTKNNPIIIGEAGVGKTAVVEGLAQHVISRYAPMEIKSKRIIEISFGSLLSGTKYRGEFEQKIQEILDETKKDKNIILFIDEFHTIAGTGKTEEGTLDAANILKPALSRGEIRCIGATTIADYRRLMEKDPALERRFQTVLIEEPTTDETLAILRGLKESYEQHHKVSITEEAMHAAIEYSVKYIWDRYLPDKAIDLIDQAASQKKLFTLTLKAPDWKRLSMNKGEMKKVGSDDIALVVSEWTGIPVQKISEEESRKLLRLESSISERIIGQEEAITTVAKVIRSAKVGLDDPQRPNGVFLFLGPTGVGKTELAKALAEFLFENENRLIRFDMSEFMESHSVSKLIGAPPGYIGYDSEGLLTGKVRTCPYSVVLFDEIEKAHPSIFDLFLQIFDEGHLTDSHGRIVNFSNTVIIMTSNVGTELLSEDGAIGFTKSDAKARVDKRAITNALKTKFRPELLNRIDEIVIFRFLDEEDIRKIILKLNERMNTRLKEKDLKLVLDPEFESFLLEQGYSKDYGAREMERTMQRLLSNPLAEAILKSQFDSGDVIIAKYDESGEKVVFEKQPVAVGP